MSTNKNTKLRVYTTCKFVEGDDPTKSFKELNMIAKCKNGPSVIANVALYDDRRQKSRGFKSYFLIHRDEFEALKNSTNYTMDQKLELIENLDFFVKHRTKRQFFIREFGGQFFLNEILNLIPYFVDLSENTIDLTEKYVKPFQLLAAAHLVRTITIEQVNEILEDFDIDKGRITVIPDIIHSLTSASPEPAICIAPNGAHVIQPSSAMLRIFYSLILYKDWSEEECKQGPFSMRQYKEKTIKLLENYTLNYLMHQKMHNFLVPGSQLKEEIVSVLLMRFSRIDYNLDRRTPNIFFDYQESGSEDCIEDYERIVKVFGLPALQMNPPLSIFNAKMCLMAAWMTLVHPKNKKVKRTLLEAFVESESVEDTTSAKSLIDTLCEDGDGRPAIADIPKIINEYLCRIRENLDDTKTPYSIHQRLPEAVKDLISPEGVRKFWLTEQSKFSEVLAMEETEKVELSDDDPEDEELYQPYKHTTEQNKLIDGLIIQDIEKPYMDAVYQNVSDYFHHKPDILSAFAKSLAEIVQQNQDLKKLVAENGSYAEIAELVCSLCSCPMVLFRVILYKVSEHIKSVMMAALNLTTTSSLHVKDSATVHALRNLWALEKADEFLVSPKFQLLGDKLMNVVFESYIDQSSNFEQQIFSTALKDPRVKLMLKKKDVMVHKESKLPMEVHRFCLEHIARYDLIQPMVAKEFQRGIDAKYDKTLHIEDDKSSITTDEAPEAPPKRCRSPKKKRTQPKHPERRKPCSPPKFITGRLLKFLGKTRRIKTRKRTPDPPYRPNREAKKEPEPQVQKESETCDKCYRMSQYCIFYKKYLVRTKMQLENCRIKANKYDDLEKKMGEQTKMMGEKMEEKDRKIAELEKLLNARNDEQSARIAELEAQLAASQEKILELEDSSRNAHRLSSEISDYDAKTPGNKPNPNSSAFDAILHQNQTFIDMKSRMKRMEEKFKKLEIKTSSPPASDFEALQDQILDKTATLRVSERENSILVTRNVSLKEEVERLNREMEVMRERENAKDVELKKSQRDNEVLKMTVQKHEESFKDVYYRVKNCSSCGSTVSSNFS